jgi:hypothetical protein
MKRRYVLAGLGVLALLAVASSALGGPSLHSLVKQEVSKQLAAQTAKSKRGRRGPTGPAGPAGTNGTNGTNGAPGSPAASAFLGRATGLNGATPIQFVSPLGSSSPTLLSNVEMGAPNADTVAQDLHVTANTAPGLVGTVQYEIVISSTASGILGCSMSGVSQTTCDSGTQTGAIPAGDGISLRITSQMSPSEGSIEFGWRATTP